jgi:hypothetical protein
MTTPGKMMLSLEDKYLVFVKICHTGTDSGIVRPQYTFEAL